jgi:hypothetical protein
MAAFKDSALCVSILLFGAKLGIVTLFNISWLFRLFSDYINLVIILNLKF